MPRFATTILSVLHLSLLAFQLPLATGAESPPLVANEPILVHGTKGRFDYLKVDEQLQRLLANHTENGTLDVYDLPDGTLRQTVPIGAVHDIGIDLARGKYYLTVGNPPNLTIVDRQTLKVEGSVPLPGAADGCAFDSKNGLVYVDHDNGEDIWVVDPINRRIVTVIKIPKDPEFILYDPVSDRVYQNIKSKPVLLVIDPTANSVSETWSTEPAEKAHGLAIDAVTHQLFSAGGNGKLSLLDSGTGKVLATADVVSGIDQIAFDPGNKRIYCASGRAGLSVAEETPDGLRSLGNIPTSSGAHTLAVDPASHDVWIAYAKENESFVCKLSVPR